MNVSRARNVRKRPADDAPYPAPSNATAALKRAAKDVDPDAPPRAKRKRLDLAQPILSSHAAAEALHGYGLSYRSTRADRGAADDDDDDDDFQACPGTPAE
jgi:hypothetical protein